MKIAILTSHSPYNFGANLQAYTTSEYLKSLGHKPVVIDYGRKEKTQKYRKMVPQEQWCAHDKFIEEMLPLSIGVDNNAEIKELFLMEKFDGVIVGADAVWSWPKKQKDIPVYFLDWLFSTPQINHIPAASMSVANMSAGFKHLDKGLREQTKNAISQFRYLSVRDEWTKDVINNHLFKSKEIVQIVNPDPVFMIDQFVDVEFRRNGIISENEKYIICTFPLQSLSIAKWFLKFREYANKRGFSVGQLPLPEGKSNLDFDFTVPYPIDPIQWYLWLKNSSGFVGLRYHALVCCISGETPFFSIDSYGSTSLPVRLLNRFGIYNAGKAFDTKSKIYQLLKYTQYNKRRVHNIDGLLGVDSRNLLDLLLDTDKSKLVELKQDKINTFILNFKQLMDIIANSSDRYV